MTPYQRLARWLLKRDQFTALLDRYDERIVSPVFASGWNAHAAHHAREQRFTEAVKGFDKAVQAEQREYAQLQRDIRLGRIHVH